MPIELRKVLYTAVASVEGGRSGHGRTDDGRLDVAIDAPVELAGDGGPGTNPEQLFALGYAACFHSAVLRVARARDLDAAHSRMTARVGLGLAVEGGFGLKVDLDLEAPGIPRESAEELVEAAHQVCPYSRATRGNIEVTLAVGGVPLAAERLAGGAPPAAPHRRVDLQVDLPVVGALWCGDVEQLFLPVEEGRMKCHRRARISNVVRERLSDRVTDLIQARL